MNANVWAEGLMRRLSVIVGDRATRSPAIVGSFVYQPRARIAGAEVR